MTAGLMLIRLMRSIHPRQLTIIFAGAISFAAWVWMAALSRRAEPLTLIEFFTVMATAWVALGLAWWGAKYLTPRALLVALWTGAVAFRLVGLFGNPILEDDWARYLWDGRMLVTTGNPYGKPPEDFQGSNNLSGDWERVLATANNPDLPTIYAPVCQAAFAASYLVAPGKLWPLKFLLIGVELATLALLLGMVPPRHALLFAWCPLLIKETAFTAHPDALWVGATVWAMWSFSKRRWKTLGVACGLAVAAKVFALIIVPFLLWRAPRRATALCLAVLFAGYGPFWIQGSLADLPALREMAGLWEFNGTIVTWLASLTGLMPAKVIGLACFATLWFAMFWKWVRAKTVPRAGNDRALELPRADLAFSAFLLLSAVVNPWYLGALAAFSCLRPSGWAVGAIIAAVLAYVHGGNLPGAGLEPYELAVWVRPAELGIVAGGYLLGATGLFPDG